jgi:hypothetical protein
VWDGSSNARFSLSPIRSDRRVFSNSAAVSDHNQKSIGFNISCALFALFGCSTRLVGRASGYFSHLRHLWCRLIDPQPGEAFFILAYCAGSGPLGVFGPNETVVRVRAHFTALHLTSGPFFDASRFLEEITLRMCRSGFGRPAVLGVDIQVDRESPLLVERRGKPVVFHEHEL